MPTHLFDLPQEIRNMIWDELLSVDKNMLIRPGTELAMTWSVETSLFYVSKQLSLETISYFYTRNLFVCISQAQMDGLFHQGLIMGPLTHIIPFKYIRTQVENEAYLPPTVLRIKFTQGVIPTYLETETGIGAIMSATHLPTLVQVFNGYHSTPTHPGWCILPTPITKFTLDFKFTSKHYPENHHKLNKLLASLKGLGSWLLEYHNHPLPPRIEIQIWNWNSPHPITPLFNFPPLTIEQTLVEARKIQGYADKLLQSGNFLATAHPRVLYYNPIPVFSPVPEINSRRTA